VYIADHNNGHISVFLTDDQTSFTFGKEYLCCPFDVEVSPHNQLLVTDIVNHFMVVFSLNGTYTGNYPIGQSYPCSITTDSNGILFVTDNKCISIFDLNGKLINLDQQKLAVLLLALMVACMFGKRSCSSNLPFHSTCVSIAYCYCTP